MNDKDHAYANEHFERNIESDSDHFLSESIEPSVGEVSWTRKLSSIEHR